MPLPAVEREHSFGQYHKYELGWIYDSVTGATDAEKRRKLTLDLFFSHAMVVPEYANAALASRYVEQLPYAIPSFAVAEGVVLVNASHDGTTRSGPIISGKPVVLDYRSGRTVTGIHPTWKTGEYFPVGMAMDNLITPGAARIPVRLIPPSDVSEQEVFLGVSIPEDVLYNGVPLYPRFEDWCKRSINVNTWRFVPYANAGNLAAIGLDNSNAVPVPPGPPFEGAVYARNMAGAYYVPIYQPVILQRTGGKGGGFTFWWTDDKVYTGILIEDLVFNQPAAVQSGFGQSTQTTAWIWNGLNPATWYVPSGSQVTFAVGKNSGDIYDTRGIVQLSYIAISADMCPQASQEQQ